MTLIRGSRLGRYEILDPLGKGGMGEVYRAKDAQLGREVAVKVLPEHLAEDPVALKRFESEARALAALSHPNILAIHDSGIDQGVTYAVMELLEGETLRERCGGSAIPWRKALEIGVAVANGLTAAHTKGVIHRDLKPENIFLTKDGRIKILDFGLARLAPVVPPDELNEAPTESKATGFGAVVGTVPYMSPEQVRGETLDARSDLFSLGCILYEMVAGKRPFSGSSAAETVSAILRDDPLMPAGIPIEVQCAIERCLEKNPDLRFHSAHDLAFALKDISSASGEFTSAPSGVRPLAFRTLWIAAVVLGLIVLVFGWKLIGFRKKSLSELPLKKIQSLAVLPLKNLSGDPKQEYFADGMTEELIGKLGRIASLRVISRTSVMEYKNAHKSLPQIARELNVDAIVEGSVSLAGNSVHITARLIEAKTDHQLWADDYDNKRDLQDILVLQNDVASAIVRGIQVKLAPQEAAELASAHQVDPQAYEAYLRGLNYSESEITTENLRLAVEMFQEAVDLDPDFASAYAELSKAQGFRYFLDDPSPERLAKAKAAVDRAFELQPGLAEGHVALGYYYYRGFRDYDRALQEFTIAQKTLPNNKAILAGTGTIYRRRGRFEEALAAELKLLAINPRFTLAACDVGVTYSYMRNYAEAQRYFDLCISLGPDEDNGYIGSADNLIRWKGDIRGARAVLNRAPHKKKDNEPADTWFWLEVWDRKYQAALDSPNLWPLAAARVYLFTNKPYLARASIDIALKHLEQELQETPDDYMVHARLGIAYAGLGRKEEAIREGKRAVELLPVSKDAMEGPNNIENLAYIYIMAGEQDAALDQIEYLLSIPCKLSVAMLRIDPRFDPLRNNPRFQKLLKAIS